MWILHFLPNWFILWFCNIVLLLGIVTTVAGFFIHRLPIPLLWQYQLPFKIIGILLLTAGVYFRGGYAVEQQWRERVAELEAKMQVAQAQSAQENKKIETKVEYRTQVVKQQGEVITQFIDREVVKYNNTCVIPQPFIEAHNRATENPSK